MLTEPQIEEMMARVRRLELKARRLVRESFAGEYLSSFRGQGLDFDDFREYQHGDEVRFIDWNVTARMNQPFVRKFREERELSVILAVDVSGSTIYGSESMSKREIAAEAAATIDKAVDAAWRWVSHPKGLLPATGWQGREKES